MLGLKWNYLMRRFQFAGGFTLLLTKGSSCNLNVARQVGDAYTGSTNFRLELTLSVLGCTVRSTRKILFLSLPKIRCLERRFF